MRPVVLIFSACYLPGLKGGGPIRTISNLVERLGDTFDFRIVATDRDLGDEVPYENIRGNSWQRVGKALVFYASARLMGLRWIAGLLSNTPHDVLYLNSFFSFRFTILPLFIRRMGFAPRKPVIIAPRGELSKDALAIKFWKKYLYLKVAGWVGLFRGVIWQASSVYEQEDIRRAIGWGGQCRIHVAENFSASRMQHVDIGKVRSEVEADDSSRPKLRICFLSRIVPMKNLDFALSVLSGVKADVDFNIFGPKESASYWNECERIIKRLPSNVRVSYRGAVDNSLVQEVISAHDIFFVPSKGENFGHVFMEAFAAGVPILVSDRTPWRGLSAKNIGWDISLDSPSAFLRVIDEASDYDAVKLGSMRNACISFAHERSGDEGVLRMNRDLFFLAMADS